MPHLFRRTCWALLAVLLVAGVWTAAVLLSVRSDLTAAREQLTQAADAEDQQATLRRVAAARARLDRASDRLGHPGPRLVAALPLVGRTVDAVRDVTDATRAVVVGGEQLLEALPESLMAGGRLDLAAMTELAQAAERAGVRSRGPVARLDEAELALVPRAVADPVREAQGLLADAPRAFGQTSQALTGLRGLLGAGSPRSLLVMLQNNGELRGTGGLVTVFARATAREGRLEVAAFRDVQDVADTADEVTEVAAPEDYEALWGPFLANTTLWLNVNMTPDVPTASGVLADVAVESGLPRPDGVLWLDVPAIAALLGATGPVRLPDGTELTERNAVRVLLSEEYEQAVDSREGQAARRGALRAAADAVLTRLLDADGPQAPASRLVRALAEAAAGRHIALWSADDREQRALLAGGLAGQVTAAGDDLSAVALQNFGGGNRQGNKLDYYARRQVTVRAVVGADEAVVEQEVAIRNTAPATGLPEYVAGQVDPGTSRSYVALAVPRDARAVRLSRGGRPVPAVVRPSGDHGVVTDGIVLAPGATAVLSLRYRLPVSDGLYRLQLVPQPLAVDAGLLVEVSAGDGRQLRGGDVVDGRLRVSGPFEATTTVAVQAERPGLVQRVTDAVARFWNEPVRLP